jgi:hypothetical protein
VAALYGLVLIVCFTFVAIILLLTLLIAVMNEA